MPEEMKVGCARPVGASSEEEKKPVIAGEPEEKKSEKGVPMIKRSEGAGFYSARVSQRQIYKHEIIRLPGEVGGTLLLSR
jgi:hypothetical protein